MKTRKLCFNRILFPAILGITLLLDLLALTVPGFADRYRETIFHRIGALYARVTGLFPFSVGEILIAVGILWLVLLPFLLLFGGRRRCAKEQKAPIERSGETDLTSPRRGRDKTGGRTLRFSALVFTGRLLVLIALVMSLNCFILYQAFGCRVVRKSDGTPVSDAATDTGSDTASAGSARSSDDSLADSSSDSTASGVDAAGGNSGSYTLERLSSLRDYVVSECNTRAESVPRDADGEVIFAGVTDSDPTGTGLVSAEVRTAIAEEVITCMHSLSDDYPLLTGYYPHPKAMLASALMSQMNMEGYYFPFSMEANYNKYMTVCNYAPCMAHELSHLKGYLREDDCNMLAFLACIRSDDPAVVYSGYLSILYYVDNDFYYSIGKDNTVYLTHEQISDTVRADNTYLVPAIKERIEANSPLDTEQVTKTTKTLTDATLKANGVSSGWNNYNEVVKLLLDWYAG